MKIRGNTVGTTIKPEKILVKSENLTENEKEQARKNIGAMGYGVVYLVSWDGDTVEVACESADKDDTGYTTAGRVGFYAVDNDQRVILSHIHDGIDGADAATVGQVKAVDLTEPKELTDEQKAQARKNIGAIGDGAEIGGLHFCGYATFDDGAHIHCGDNIIHGVIDPETDTDAANKGYVDEAIATAIANLPVYNGEVEEV